MKIVPATNELLDEYYEGKPYPTVRAYVVLNDENKPVAVGGFYRLRYNLMAIFSESKEGERQKHKVTAYKFAKFLLGIADENGWILYADPDSMIETAPKFLERLGFRDVEGVYLR